ncbi:MAG: hypothetical protein U0271_38890 [Polyangiaceae bacterium]
MKLSIVQAGLVGHTGDTAQSLAMGLRAGLVKPTRFRGAGVRPAMGTDLTVRPLWQRLLLLSQKALAQALAMPAPSPPVPVLMVVPDDTRLSSGDLDELLNGLATIVPRPRPIRGGASEFADALMLAEAALAKGASRVLVGGVDSDLDAPWLERLERERRLFGFEQDGGILPSEGAAFLLLERCAPETPRPAGRVAITWVGNREERRWPESPGAELTFLVRSARAALAPEETFDWVLVDAQGERAREREWQFAEVRNRAIIPTSSRVDRPLLEAGNVGAATGPWLAAMGATLMDHGAAPASVALMVLRSDEDDATRVGAVVLRREGPSKESSSIITPLSVQLPDSGALEVARARAVDECLEDIGSMGALLSADLDEAWTTGRRFQERLLYLWDALCAYAVGASAGTIEEHCRRLARAWPSEDGMRAFARVFVLAGFWRPRELAAALSHHAVRLAPLERALALSPATDEQLFDLMTLAGGEELAAILGALSRRGHAHLTMAVAALDHPAPLVRANAARNLGSADWGARESLLEILDERAADESDDRVLHSIAESLLRLGSRRGLALARERIDLELDAPGTIGDEQLVSWSSILGAVGSRADTPRLARALERCPMVAHAVGFSGDPTLAEPLVELLRRFEHLDDLSPHWRASARHDEPELVARALRRLTGQDPQTTAGDAEDGPRRSRLTTESATWAIILSQFVPPADKRVRAGRAFDMNMVIEELCDATATLRDRRVLLLEAGIVVRSASSHPTEVWLSLEQGASERLRATFKAAASRGLSCEGESLEGRLA